MGNLISFSPTPSASEDSQIRPNQPIGDPPVEDQLGDIVISDTSSDEEEEEDAAEMSDIEPKKG